LLYIDSDPKISVLLRNTGADDVAMSAILSQLGVPENTFDHIVSKMGVFLDMSINFIVLVRLLLVWLVMKNLM
jgi:hypothetical protein